MLISSCLSLHPYLDNANDEKWRKGKGSVNTNLFSKMVNVVIEYIAGIVSLTDSINRNGAY